MQLIFATSNRDKAREVSNLLPESDLLTLMDIGFQEEIEETGATLEENAWIKANTIFQRYNKPTFADDTGLLVETLGNQPGVYSARYAGPSATYAENCSLLLQNMAGESNRQAIFRTVFCLILPDQVPLFFGGEVTGKILTSPRGNGGFGYDPVFEPLGSQKSFAEMTLEEKNANSHRAKALRALAEFLNGLKESRA